MYRKVAAVGFSTLLAACILGFMLFRVWDDLLTALVHSDPLFLALAVLICSISWWVRGYRYQVILDGLAVRISLGFSTACILISQTVNLIVPARLGDLVRVVILKHENKATVSQGISSVVVERVFDILMVAVLGALSLPLVLDYLDVPDWFVTVTLLPIVAGVVFFLFLLAMKDRESGNKYLRFVLNMFNEVRAASLTFKSLFLLSGTSLVIWLLDAMACGAVVAMFGEKIPFVVVILAVVIGNLVKAVPLTPGGVGTYELSVALTFQLAGVSPAVATLIAVIDHLIKNLVTAAGGIISIYAFGDWVLPALKKTIERGREGGDDGGGS